MAEMMWCPNCEQKVGAQKKTSNLGTVFVVMVVSAIVLAFFVPPLGALLGVSAGVLLVVGLVWELVGKAMPDNPTCPICRGDSLKAL